MTMPMAEADTVSEQVYRTRTRVRAKTTAGRDHDLAVHRSGACPVPPEHEWPAWQPLALAPAGLVRWAIGPLRLWVHRPARPHVPAALELRDRRAA